MNSHQEPPIVQCVVPISGGKDSQVCLELALETFPRSAVRGLFCDTNFEHPLTYEHVDWMERYYGVAIDRADFGSVLDKALKYGRFPGGGARFCTEALKMVPTKVYLRWLTRLQGTGVEVWYGMRASESPQRSRRYSSRISTDLYEPHELFASSYPKYLSKMGVRFRLPILDWSEKDVWIKIEGRANPLYEHFDRVGCFPCLASGDTKKEAAFRHDAFGRSQYVKVQALAETLGRSIWISDNWKGKYDGPGCALCAI